MAARTRTKRDDELEPGTAGSEGDDEHFTDEAPDDELGDADVEVEDDEEADGEFLEPDQLESVEDLSEREAEEADAADDLEEDLHVVVRTVPDAVAEFDDDRQNPSVDDDDDEDEVEGLRAGEFVCRSCFLARRESQLADPDQMLCRDCA